MSRLSLFISAMRVISVVPRSSSCANITSSTLTPFDSVPPSSS
jgi:hypothetical protein